MGVLRIRKVVSGMNVVQAIEKVPTTSRSRMRDVPETPVVIRQASGVPTESVGGGSENNRPSLTDCFLPHLST